MALTNTFYEALQAGNVLRIRIMMKDSLLFDPTFATFFAMEKETLSMKGLYDEHDGKELIEDRKLWNDDYMNKVMVEVLYNFSHERIEHLKEVVRFLRPVQENVPKTELPKTESVHKTEKSKQRTFYQEEKRHSQERGDYIGVKIGAGAMAGAIVGGTVTAVAGASVAGMVVGITAGAVVGGAVVAATVQRR